jgi:peptidoglycan/LPS O-acetylase OafA/YrhL
MLFFLAGSFLAFDRYRRSLNMWFLVLAAGLLFIGCAMLIDSTQIVDEQYIGVMFFVLPTGLFKYAYLQRPERWGLLLPAGILFTLAAMVWLDMHPAFDDGTMGSLFFLGIGSTFGVLYLTRNPKNNLAWAKIPAIVLIGFACFVFLVSSESFLATFFLPLALIAIGVFLVYRAGKTANPSH